MSFSFGQSFGATTKPAAFGTPFGGTMTTASGGFGNTFGGGNANTTFGTPAFGNTSFGAPAPVSTSTAFGNTFGTPSSSNTAPNFGASFGTPAAASAAPAFGTSFGTATTSASAFGTTFGAGASASSAPNLFGSPAATAPKQSLFATPNSTALFQTPTATNLFSTTSSQAPALFGGSVTTAPNLFATTSAAPMSLFGSSFGTTGTTPGGLFGASSSGLSTGGTGFNLFGSTTTTTPAPSLFTGFGTTTTPSGFMGFGASTNNFTGFGGANSNLFGNTFGAKPTTPVAAPGMLQQVDSKAQQTLASFYAINIYDDERDNILKKWNMLQACWGIGKGYYNVSLPPVEYNHTNPFYRFKGIGYVVIPQTDNADGLVKIHFNKKESELNGQKEALVNGISGILGNKQNLTVTVEHVKALSDNESEVMISVSEKGVTGTSRKIHASDLSSFLNQPMQKQQLSSVGVTFIGPYMAPTKAQLEDYSKVPPPGIDPQMWQMAQVDNPQPQKYLPTPINGFTDLKKRMLCEEYETGLHRAFLEKVNNDINELKRKHASSIAQISEQKQKFQQLQHRVLKILVKQEVTRKVGMALQPEEEMIRGRLEMMHSQLGIPTQFKGQINELLSSVKVMNILETNTERYKMEPRVQDDVKQFLQMEQNGISHLINIINSDLKDLKTIQDGLNQLICK